MHTKANIIDDIQQINQSAAVEWLHLFEPSALHRYLERLHWMLEPRHGSRAWLRDGETPAMITRQPHD